MEVSPLRFNQYVGVRFRPTDQQLLQYLRCKIYGLPYFQGAVFDCDLYGGNEPWEIWKHFQGIDGQDLYFFTKLKRSTNKSGRLSSHINRKIGLAEGTWSGENKANPIFADETNEHIIIGYNKRFRYENKLVPDHNGEWIMHEYSLHENLISKDADPDYVLCRIRKNERPKRKAENICMQPTRKRIMADDPRMSQMKKNETSSRKRKKICYSELQPIEQRVTNESCKPSDHGTNDIPFEIPPYQGPNDIPFEIPPYQGPNDIPFEIPPHQGPNDIPFEIPPHQGPNDIPFEIPPHQGPNDIPFEIPPHQGPNDIPFEIPPYQGPNDIPFEIPPYQGPNDIPFEIPPYQGPNDIPFEIPPQGPNDIPFEIPPQGPNDIPFEIPFEFDIPFEMTPCPDTNDIPFEIPFEFDIPFEMTPCLDTNDIPFEITPHKEWFDENISFDSELLL